MKINFFGKTTNYIHGELPQNYKKYFSNLLKRNTDKGDTFELTPLKEGEFAEDYEHSSIKDIYLQTKRHLKAYGVNFWDVIRCKWVHNSDAIPVGFIDIPILGVKKLAEIPVKGRNRASITARIDKILNGSCGIGEDYSYVIKKDGKQLGSLSLSRHPNNEFYICYLDTVLGRKKYRNLEAKLIQIAVEDCLKEGFIPKFKAYAVNLGRFMGRGYNNKALYRRMGMECTNSENPDFMEISEEKVIKLLEKYLKMHGEIYSGTRDRLAEYLNKNKG